MPLWLCMLVSSRIWRWNKYLLLVFLFCLHLKTIFSKEVKTELHRWHLNHNYWRYDIDMVKMLYKLLRLSISKLQKPVKQKNTCFYYYLLFTFGSFFIKIVLHFWNEADVRYTMCYNQKRRYGTPHSLQKQQNCLVLPSDKGKWRSVFVSASTGHKKFFELGYTAMRCSIFS